MRNILIMNASVIFFIACLTHVNIFYGNSLYHVNKESDGKDEFDMSYLECTNHGCQLIKASIKNFPKPGPWVVESDEANRVHSRSKRKMFFPDNRLRLREKTIGRYPFNSAVAIRVNGVVTCSGVALLRPKFFLTAAHCVQPDGKRKDIEVGVLHKYRAMQWAEVETIRAPSIWRNGKATKKNLLLKDYAVLKSKTALPVTPMKIGYVGLNPDGSEMLEVNKTYIYFSAFDGDKGLDDLYMRFCQMRKIKPYRIFSQCDTVTKTAGAGVYVRMRNKETGMVERKVIAIATGDYGVKANQEYSVALRINSRMFPHICRFVTERYDQCN